MDVRSRESAPGSVDTEAKARRKSSPGNDKITAPLWWLEIAPQELTAWMSVDIASPVKAMQATALTSSTIGVGLVTPTGRGACMYFNVVEIRESLTIGEASMPQPCLPLKHQT